MGRLFLMRNPFMKFKTLTLFFFERTDGHTAGWTSPKQYIFNGGGIKSELNTIQLSKRQN